MQGLTPDEVTRFLAQPNRHAVVATIAPDGTPQLSPVWYLYEAGRMFISIASGSAKHRNLMRDPRIGICVDGGRDDVRTVMLYGRAELVDVDVDADVDSDTRWRIVRGYYETEDAARRYYASVKKVGHVLIALEPERIVSQDFRD